MQLPQDFADDASVLARAGAAGRALECDGVAYSGGGGAYDDGLESVKGSPERALRNYFEEEFVGAQPPVTGYRIEREDAERVLFSYDVEGRTRVAFIVEGGITDYNGDRGWGVESRAACDPSEVPAAVTEALGIGVWQDRSGDRLPVTTVRSYEGARHCDWQDITFLTLGEDPNSRRGERSSTFVTRPGKSPTICGLLLTRTSLSPPGSSPVSGKRYPPARPQGVVLQGPGAGGPTAAPAPPGVR